MTEDHRSDILSFPSELADQTDETDAPDLETSQESDDLAPARNILPFVTRVMRRVRAVRIQVGRLWRAVSPIGRRSHSSSKGSRRPKVLGVVRRWTQWCTGLAGRHPRKTAIIAGGLIVAAVFVRWNRSTESQIETTRSGSGRLTLDKVVVLPPEERNKTASKSGTRVPAGDSRGDSKATPLGTHPGRSTVSRSPRPSPFPRRMPTVPRAVWLTGTIENVRETPATVRPTSHIELPMYSRRRVAPVSLREIEMRQRDLGSIRRRAATVRERD